MRWIPSRWFWGVVPLVLIILIVNLAERPRIEQSLKERAEAALREAGLSWARLTFEGRDGRLSGRAYSDEDRKRASDLVGRIRGIRIVDDQADLLSEASPYTFSVSRDENRLKLKGYMPDEKNARRCRRHGSGHISQSSGQ